MQMTVQMLTTVMGESGTLLLAGSSYTVSDDFGAELVGSKRAMDVNRVLVPPSTENHPYFSTDSSGNVTGLVGPDGSLKLAKVSGSGWHRPFGSSPSPATAYSFALQVPSIPKFVGVQLGYLNLGVATYTISGAKVASPPTVANGGTTLTWVDATFDGGVSSTATPKVVPAGSGSGVNVIPGGFTVTDVIPLVGTDRTDLVGNPNLLQTRTYISTASNLNSLAGGALAAYVAATGLEYGCTIMGGDQVTTITNSMAPSTAGTWICPAFVKFFYEAPTINVAAVGDSLTRGQGSTSGHTSGEEIACRQLTTVAKVYALTNMGVSGQSLAASYSTAVALLNSSMAPDVLVWKAFSPNDAYTQANYDAAYLYLLRLIDLCKQKDVVLIVRNAQRWNQSAGVTTTIEAFNARIAKLTGTYINDDYGILSDGSSEPTKNNPAYSVSAGDPHLSDAGYAALAASLKKLIVSAFPV